MEAPSSSRERGFWRNVFESCCENDSTCGVGFGLGLHLEGNGIGGGKGSYTSDELFEIGNSIIL
tara:strand:+ start:1109 stop:1300 length:192 start_codon:yes stop_codon:yes gene_type:complete